MARGREHPLEGVLWPAAIQKLIPNTVHAAPQRALQGEGVGPGTPEHLQSLAWAASVPVQPRSPGKGSSPEGITSRRIPLVGLQ